MRILLIVVYYPPSTTSAAPLMRDLALEYVRQGHEAVVVTPSSSVSGRISVTDEEGVTVVRVKCGDIKHANKVQRLWRESQMSDRIWRNAKSVFEAKAIDLVIFYAPSIFFGQLVQRLKALWGCPSYLILRDIFPQWAVDAGLLKENGILHQYLKHKERQQYLAADVIGVEAKGNIGYLERELSNKKPHTELLYNWVSARQVEVGPVRWREKLGIEERVVFIYGGNIGVAQDMDNILRLASGLKDRDDVFFLLVGEGSEAQSLKAKVEALKLQNIKILGAIPEDDYLQCVAECDVGLVSLDRRLKSNNFPGKILGYVACGKPILASLNPGNDLLHLLRDADAGIACINGNDESLRDAALFLASQPIARRRMGRNSRALGESTLSVNVIAKQILSHFERT